MRINIESATAARRLDDPSPDALAFATRIVRQVCHLCGDRTMFDDTPRTLRLKQALEGHDTPWIYDWLISAFSYQGISDHAAWTFIEKNGNASWQDLEAAFRQAPSCPQLKTYWHFNSCGYIKSRQLCHEPRHRKKCPLPALPLRNGRLNQSAFSLYLFMRDVCGGDFVGWLDKTLRPYKASQSSTELHQAREALLGPMRDIYGVADKVLSMSLATLLLGAPQGKKHWARIGGSMIAVDTLVHNFLHRTGILQALDADHPYGVTCYGEDGCVGVISKISSEIDARAFNPDYPRVFARFVQHALWRYCAQDGLDICNGNQIDDDLSCHNIDCSIRSICKRIPLNFTTII